MPLRGNVITQFQTTDYSLDALSSELLRLMALNQKPIQNAGLSASPITAQVLLQPTKSRAPMANGLEPMSTVEAL